MCSRSPPVSSFEDGVPSLRIFGGPFAPGWGAMESYLNYIDEKLRKVPGPTGCFRIPREARRLAEVPGLSDQTLEGLVTWHPRSSTEAVFFAAEVKQLAKEASFFSKPRRSSSPASAQLASRISSTRYSSLGRHQFAQTNFGFVEGVPRCTLRLSPWPRKPWGKALPVQEVSHDREARAAGRRATTCRSGPTDLPLREVEHQA